jgi:hypothetical protein
MAGIARAKAPQPTHRLIPSRFPPIAAFEAVASAADLAQVMALEGWTNDRLVRQRLQRLPTTDWVFGRPNASVVMAAFLHAPAGGLRFSSGELGAWYGAAAVNTSIAEVGHHLRREAYNAGMDEVRCQYRAYLADLEGDYQDIRGLGGDVPTLYAPADYRASQAFGEKVRASADHGILYDSVRHSGGQNVVCYRTTSILDVRQGTHYEITLRLEGKILVRTLQAKTIG